MSYWHTRRGEHGMDKGCPHVRYRPWRRIKTLAAVPRKRGPSPPRCRCGVRAPYVMRFTPHVNHFARMPRTKLTPPIEIARSLALAAYAARRPSHSQRSIARIARLSNSTVARIDRWCAAGAPVGESYRPPTLYAYAHAIALLEGAADELRGKLDAIARDWPRS